MASRVALLCGAAHHGDRVAGVTADRGGEGGGGVRVVGADTEDPLLLGQLG